MARNYSILVHSGADSKITCARLFDGAAVETNTVKIDDLTIFASPAELRRLADVIGARLAVIDEDDRVRQWEIAVSRAYDAHHAAQVQA